LKDQTGAVIPGWGGRKFDASTSVIDISSIPYAGTRRAITADIAFSGLKASAFVAATPTLEISWKGDPLQVCATTVPSFCPDNYEPLIANGVAVSNEARTGTAAVMVNLAFDYIPSSTCAKPLLAIETKINGQRSTDPNAPVDIRVVPSLSLEIIYTVTNNGTTALLDPVLFDDAGTDGLRINDDPIIDKPVGVGNILGVRETWTYKGRARPLSDANALHPVLTGTPIDGNGKPAGILPLTEDRVFYFLSNPSLELFVGIFEGHNGGAGCRGKDTFYAPPAAEITYCYVVKNIGNVALLNIAIDDPNPKFTQASLKPLGQPGLVALLPPGQSITLYFETKNTGDLETNVKATGTSPTGVKVSDTAESTLGPRQLPAT
jgi:hypothetical protein